jgi:hypothetical protein
MGKSNILFFFILFSGTVSMCSAILCSAQQESLSPDLKAAALKDAACANPAGTKEADPELAESPIRAGGREAGAIVAVKGPCHCQATNCDVLVYLRNGQGYRLAVHEKYASLHPMKIVKLGMPSLTGQFEISQQKMETTVYDWDGKDYRPSLCATVTKGKRVPAIARHPCKPPSL